MKNIKVYIKEAIEEDERIIQRFKEELEDSSYSEYVEKLKDMCRDRKTLNLLKMVFGGEYSDIRMNKSSRPKVAKALIPTQNEVDAEKSLKKGFLNPASIDGCFANPAELRGEPIITFNRNYIVDGHHRWAQILIVNPSARCSVINFDNDEMGPIEMLKAAQGTIAADTETIKMSTVNGDNLLEVSPARARELIETWLVPETVERILYYLPDLKDRDGVVKYLMKNIKKMQNNNQSIRFAPGRDYMPQTDTDPDFEDNIVNTTKIEGNK